MAGSSHENQLGWATAEQKLNFVGSSSLTWAAVSKDVRLWEQAFRYVKIQLDSDLRHFTTELQRAHAIQQGKAAGDGTEGANIALQVSRLLQVVDEFLTLGDPAFQSSLPEVIRWLHHQRACCSSNQACLKGLYSRLLFLLSRCSRLLSSEADEQPAVTAGIPTASSRAAIVSNGGGPDGLTAQLRQLLYGPGHTQYQGQTPTEAEASGVEPAESCVYDDGRKQQAQGQGEEQLYQPQKPTIRGSYRRRSTVVFPKSPTQCKDRTSLELPSIVDESARHEMMQRCNTMPVQQAEAMQQLLRQVQRSMEASCYSLQPSIVQPTDAAASLGDVDLHMLSNSKPCSHHMQQRSHHTTTCSNKPKDSDDYNSLELADSLMAEHVAHGLDKRLLQHCLDAHWSPPLQNAFEHDQQQCQPAAADAVNCEQCNASGGQFATESYLPEALSHDASQESVHILGTLSPQRCRQSSTQEPAPDSDAEPELQQSECPAGNSMRSKGWVRKQWSKLKACAKSIGLIRSIRTAPAATDMVLQPADAEGQPPNAGIWHISCDLNSTAEICKDLLVSRQVASFSGQPLSTRLGKQGSSAQCTVGAAATLTGQSSWPSAAYRQQVSTVVGLNESAKSLLHGLQQLQKAENRQQSAVQSSYGTIAVDNVQGNGVQRDVEQQQSSVASHEQQSFVLKPSHKGFQSWNSPGHGPSAAAAARDPLTWQTGDHGLSLTHNRSAPQEAATAQRRLHHSAPNSRSQSLDGGLRSARNLTCRLADAHVTDTGSPAGGAAQFLLPRSNIRHSHTASLPTSCSSGQLLQDYDTSPSISASGSWQYSHVGGSSRRISSSGLGLSRRGSSRLSSIATAEISRRRQQQQQQLASGLQGSPGVSCLKLLKQQRRGSPALPAVPAVTSAVWVDAARAGDAAFQAAARQQQLQQQGCFRSSADAAFTLSGNTAAAYGSPAGQPRALTPRGAAGHLLRRSASPSSCMSEDTALRKQVLSRCQSVGGSLASAFESELTPGSATFSSSLLHAASSFPFGAAGASFKAPWAATTSTYMSPVPGHRTCYYSDSGAVHILEPAAAATSLDTIGAVALQARSITCAICANEVLAVATNPHNDLCGMLTAELSKLKGSTSTADARLTVLAHWMEEQLMHCGWPDLLTGAVQQLVDVGRLVASLQPDGTGTPELRCTKAMEQVECVLAQWQTRMHSLALSESNAEVLAEGVADCDIVVTLCLRLKKQMLDKLKWLAEPLPVISKVDGSGTSTPRAAPVMQVSDFEMICPISRGAYGRVYKVKKKSTGDTFAIKVLTKTELVKKNMVESVTNERNILAMANNPFVVRFYYSFSSPEKLFLVMEYCPGGDLSSVLQHLGRFDEDTARQYIAETVLALEYCHSKGIIHRDLKPDNLLISSTGHIKLSDFGLSKFGGAAAAEGAAAASLDHQANKTPTSVFFNRSNTGSENSSAAGSCKCAPEVPAVAIDASAAIEAQAHSQLSSAGTIHDECTKSHVAMADNAVKDATKMFAAVQGDVRTSLDPSGNLDQQQQRQQLLQHDHATKDAAPPLAHAPNCAHNLEHMLAARHASWAPASATSAAAAAQGMRDSYACYMSPASQAVTACQMTRMIPHTSLPASPAVFLTPGMPAADANVRLCSNMPLTPAPMLQQLAAELRSDNSSVQHPLAAAGGSSSSAVATAMVESPLKAVSSVSQQGSSEAVQATWQCDSKRVSPEFPLQHVARAAAGIQVSPGLHQQPPAQSLQNQVVAVNDGSHQDPAATISFEIAETAAANLQQQQTCLSLDKGLKKRSTSWQSLLIKQHSAQQCSRMVGAGQQHNLQPGRNCHTLDVADADYSCQQLAQMVTRAAQQSLSVQRDGCSSIGLQGNHQQHFATSAHSPQPLSAPVSAAQLQQRLQAMSDKQNQQEQEEQQLSAVPDSQVTKECIADDAETASISFMGAQNAITEQLHPVVLCSDSATTTNTAYSMASSRLSLQKSLSVALPPELLTPEDAMQMCLPAYDTEAALSQACQETAVSASAVTPTSGEQQQQQQHAADMTAAQAMCQDVLTYGDACTEHQQPRRHVTKSTQSQEECHRSTQHNHAATNAPSASTMSQQPCGMKKLKHASQLTHRALGTPDYLAPERLMGMTYGPEVDWWALGVILYEFVYGAPPFNADTPQEIFERILDGNIEFFLDEDGQHVVSEECRDLITQLLQGNSEKRLGHRGAGELKLHPWFQGVQWETLARQKAAFVPLDTADAKDYFVPKPFSKLSIAADLQPSPSVSRASRDNSSVPSSSRTRRASSSSHSQQLHQTPTCSNCPTAAGSGSGSSVVYASTPTSFAAPAIAAGSGNSSLSGVVSPASAVMYAAAAQQQQQHSWVTKAWTPTSTPRSARVITPRGLVMPMPPAFVAAGPLPGNSTPGASGSSQQRQQAVKFGAALPPAAFAGPVGVAALTVISPTWSTAQAAAAAPAQSQNACNQEGGSSAADGNGAVVAGVSAKAANADVCSVDTTTTARLRSRRLSAGQVDNKQQQQQLMRHRWSSRQLDVAASAGTHQQESLAQLLLVPRHRRLSGGLYAASIRSVNSPIRPAGSVNGGTSSILTPQASRGFEHAPAIGGSDRSSQAGCDLRSWGSIYTSPASSTGGAYPPVCVATSSPAAVQPPLPSSQQQQLLSAAEAGKHSAAEPLAGVPAAAPDGTAWLTEYNSNVQQQQLDQLSPQQPSLGGYVQYDDSQQQEQQRKPRKSNCSSPQQRLKQQWAQQRLLQQLQHQQGCVRVGYAGYEGRSAPSLADVQPSDTESELERALQQLSCGSETASHPADLLQTSGTMRLAAASADICASYDAFSMPGPAVADKTCCRVSAESSDVDVAKFSLANTAGAQQLKEQMATVDATSSNGGSQVQALHEQTTGSIPCHRDRGSRLSPSSRMVVGEQGSSSSKSPAHSPSSHRGRSRRGSAAAYTAASSAAVQAAALLESKASEMDKMVRPSLYGRVAADSCVLHSPRMNLAAATLANRQGSRGLRASTDDTGYTSASGALDATQPETVCSNRASAMGMTSSSSSSLPRSLSLFASVEAVKADSISVEESGASMDGVQLSAAGEGDMPQSIRPALLFALDDNSASVSFSASPSPGSRQHCSFSVWQQGSGQLQHSCESSASSQYLSSGELGASVQEQQQNKQQSDARCGDAGASSFSGMLKSHEAAGADTATFDVCCGGKAESDTTSCAADAANFGENGQSTATDSDDTSLQVAQQLDEVDAFGDFAAVNVSALQELNIEKQRAEFLGPIEQAVSAGGTAGSLGVACEDAPIAPQIAAVQVTDAEAQYHHNMLMQYAEAAAAAGAATPALDYRGFPGALLTPDRSTTPATSASEQQWHQHQLQQQQAMLLHQQYEQYPGQANLRGMGNAGLDGGPLDDFMEYDHILAQYGIGAAPPAVFMDATARDGGPDVSVVAAIKGATGAVPAIDAGTGHIVLVDAERSWLAPGNQVHGLHPAGATHELAYPTDMLPYDNFHMDGGPEFGYIQRYPAGIVCEPILPLAVELDSSVAPVAAVAMNPDITLAGQAQAEDNPEAGAGARAGLNSPMNDEQQRSGRSCSFESHQKLSNLPRQQATEAAAVECNMSSSRQCRFLRTSLSTGHLDDLAAEARLSNPEISLQQEQQRTTRKLGSWSAKATEPYFHEDDEHIALYDALLRHEAVAQADSGAYSEAGVPSMRTSFHDTPVAVGAAVSRPSGLPYSASDVQLNHLPQQYATASHMHLLAHAFMPEQPGVWAGWLPHAPGVARSIAATMSEDGAVRMLSRTASAAAWASTAGTGRLSPWGSASGSCLLALEKSSAVVGMSSGTAGESCPAGFPAAGVPYAVPAAGKDFLAQLGAIATDGSRGYKYRASDSGHSGSSFLQRSATTSLPGTLTGTALNSHSGFHKSSLSRATLVAGHDLSSGQEDR